MYTEYIEQCYGKCIKEVRLYENYVSKDLFTAIDGLKQALEPEIVPAELKEYMAHQLAGFIQDDNYYIGVLLYSAIVHFTKAPKWMGDFLKYILRNIKYFTPNNLYFLYTQIAYVPMVDQRFENEEIRFLMWTLFQKIVQIFYSENNQKYTFIPVEERNSDFIIVLTEQFLSDGHGPTKTAMDRCRVILERMGKQVLLINTAETFSTVGEIPFVNIMDANYNPELSNLTSIEWKGTSIPYFQCEQNMPEYDSMNLILDLIAERKPYCIISMNGSSITCNLANQIIPVISINCGLSRIAVTTVSFQALGQKMTEEQKQELLSYDLPESSVIESEFTYSFREQTEHYTRQQFGIRENVFLISVIGMRLDQEITGEFCSLLNEVADDNKEVVIVGKFDNYAEMMLQYPNLKEHSYYIGSILDVVAFGEICDLYVNPTRKGAGGSILEIMKKGVPSVTCDYGDAAACVGSEFCVNDYNEMKEKILLYYNDKNYYQKMSQKATERVEYITNNDDAFIEIINEAMRREKANETYRFLQE